MAAGMLCPVDARRRPHMVGGQTWSVQANAFFIECDVGGVAELSTYSKIQCPIGLNALASFLDFGQQSHATP